MSGASAQAFVVLPPAQEAQEQREQEQREHEEEDGQREHEEEEEEERREREHRADGPAEKEMEVEKEKEKEIEEERGKEKERLEKEKEKEKERREQQASERDKEKEKEKEQLEKERHEKEKKEKERHGEVKDKDKERHGEVKKEERHGEVKEKQKQKPAVPAAPSSSAAPGTASMPQRTKEKPRPAAPAPAAAATTGPAISRPPRPTDAAASRLPRPTDPATSLLPLPRPAAPSSAPADPNTGLPLPALPVLPAKEAVAVHVVPWIVHAAQADGLGGARKAPRRQPIYAVDLHPGGARIATGGLDAVVKVWSLRAAVLDAAGAQADGLDAAAAAQMRLLAAIAGHGGAVLAVKFSPDGRFLATGSDDRRIHIHELRGGPVGLPSLGSEASTENWVTVHRLTAHEIDICDLAWSRDSRYLASSGLDTAVYIWDVAAGFRRTAKLAEHTSAVKGLAFDPAGLVLATQGDDNLVKLWKNRGSDWECVQTLPAPTRDNFFTRLGCVPSHFRPD